MTIPVVGAYIDFSNGAGFVTTAFTLDDAIKGVLGTGQLADSNTQVDISNIIIETVTRRGRNRILNRFDSGSATVIINDTNGDWNPENTAGPYYGELLPLRKIQIWADYGSTRYYLFSGFIIQYITKPPLGTDDIQTVTLQCVDAFRLFNTANVTSVSGATANQLSGARVEKILDQIGFPASLRNIDIGDSSLQVDPGTNRTSLAAIQQVEDSEFGAFFMTADGKARFLSRTAVTEYADSPTLIFSDTGVGISYQGITTALDDTTVFNDITVQRSGGTAQQVTDATSIDTYFRHSGSRTGLLLQTDTEALDMAKMLLISRKDTSVRVDTLTLNLLDTDSPARQTAGLSAELLDAIRVTKTLSGSSTLTADVLIQGIQHNIARNRFETIYFTGESLIKGFLLNSTTQGIIGTNALSY